MYKYLIAGLVYPSSVSDPVGKARNVKASPFVCPACNLVIGRVGFIVRCKKRFVNVIDCPVVLGER
jgi:hypothetical protein